MLLCAKVCWIWKVLSSFGLTVQHLYGNLCHLLTVVCLWQSNYGYPPGLFWEQWAEIVLWQDLLLLHIWGGLETSGQIQGSCPEMLRHRQTLFCQWSGELAWAGHREQPASCFVRSLLSVWCLTLDKDTELGSWALPLLSYGDVLFPGSCPSPHRPTFQVFSSGH